MPAITEASMALRFSGRLRVIQSAGPRRSIKTEGFVLMLSSLMDRHLGLAPASLDLRHHVSGRDLVARRDVDGDDDTAARGGMRMFHLHRLQREQRGAGLDAVAGRVV